MNIAQDERVCTIYRNHDRTHKDISIFEALDAFRIHMCDSKTVGVTLLYKGYITLEWHASKGVVYPRKELV
jgi:hypothetical protein